MQRIHSHLLGRHSHLNPTLTSPHQNQRIRKGLKKADIYKIQQSRQKLVTGREELPFCCSCSLQLYLLWTLTDTAGSQALGSRPREYPPGARHGRQRRACPPLQAAETTAPTSRGAGERCYALNQSTMICPGPPPGPPKQ